MSKKEKNIIGYVTPLAENKFFTFIAFHYLYEKAIKTFEREIYDVLKFFDTPPKFVKTSVKGIIFNIVGFYKNGDVTDYDICQKLVAKLNLLKIPFRFVTDRTLNFMSKMISAKINPEVDIEVLQISIDENDDDDNDDDDDEDYGTWFYMVWLSRTNNGYIETRKIYSRETYDPTKLLHSSNPNKIIITGYSEKALKLRKCLSSWNPVIYDSSFGEFQALKALMDHIFDNTKNSFFIVPQSLDNFGITFLSENSSYDDILLFVRDGQDLPFTKSFIVPRFHKTFYVAFRNEDGYSVLSTPYHITKEGHRFNLTLSIDINTFPSITHETVILPRIQKMPKKLNIEKTEKLPIIGFFDNSSVICLWNENENCYKFMDTWNGKFGKDLFLNFMLPRPRLALSSTNITSSPGVVYDLIKIMSMPSNDIKIDRNWKFTFTKDAENPVLLEFDTAEDGRKAASPAFLMALMLKQHLKAIRKEIDQKPVKIGIRLLDDFENLESKKLVEAGMQEACEMLKLRCFFV